MKDETQIVQTINFTANDLMKTPDLLFRFMVRQLAVNNKTLDMKLMVDILREEATVLESLIVSK